MMHIKMHPKKPLFSVPKEQELFMSLFNDVDEDNHKEVAKLLFCDGETCMQVAEATNYSTRHIERLKVSLLKVALKRAIRKIVTMVSDNNAQ